MGNHTNESKLLYLQTTCGIKRVAFLHFLFQKFVWFLIALVYFEAIDFHETVCSVYSLG